MILLFKNGLTVAELKAIVANLPDTDAFGQPAEIWVETEDGLSSPVVEVATLNSVDLCFSTFFSEQ